MTDTEPRAAEGCVYIGEPIRKCVFCDQDCDDGVSINGKMMKLWDGKDDDWGHLECYLSYAIHVLIDTILLDEIKINSNELDFIVKKRAMDEITKRGVTGEG